MAISIYMKTFFALVLAAQSTVTFADEINLKCTSNPTQNTLGKTVIEYITVDKDVGIIKHGGRKPIDAFINEDSYRWSFKSERSATNLASNFYYESEHTLHRKTGRLSSTFWLLNSNGGLKSISEFIAQCELTQALDL